MQCRARTPAVRPLARALARPTERRPWQQHRVCSCALLHSMSAEKPTVEAPAVAHGSRLSQLDDPKDQCSVIARLTIGQFSSATCYMAMMFFAVPFVFGSLRNSGAGLRLMIGVLIGVGFYVINEVTANFGQLYGWPPVLAASAPTGAGRTVSDMDCGDRI